MINRLIPNSTAIHCTIHSILNKLKQISGVCVCAAAAQV